MRLKLMTVLLLTCCMACSDARKEEPEATKTELKFDKARWRLKEDKDYPYRSRMLKDLIASVPLKGMHNRAVVELLGLPDRVNEGHLYYRVSEKKAGFLILNTKTLVIKLAADSTVEWRKIHG